MPDTNPSDHPTEDTPAFSSSLSTIEAILVPEGKTRRPFYTTDAGDFVIPDDLTAEEYVQGLKDFKNYQAKGKLYFAKYLAYGELKFGKDLVNKHLGQLEFDLPSVSQAMLIMSIPEDMHYPNLTAEHYIALARTGDLTKPQKARWARTASEQNLSPSTLRASIEAGEVVSPEVARKQSHGIMSIHGVRMEMDIWLRRVNGPEGILKQEEDNVREIIGELDVFVQLHTALVSGLEKKKSRPARKEKEHAATV